MSSRLSFASLVGLLGLLCLLMTWCLVRLEPDLMDLPRQWHLLNEATSRGEELDQTSLRLKHCLEIKFRVVQDLLQGRTTLLQAASVFRDLNLSLAPARLPRQFDSGATLEERSCREVIDWVRMNLEEKSDKTGPDLVQRLEAELSRRLTHPGGLQLPDRMVGEI